MWSYVEGSGEQGKSREKISVFEHVVLKRAEKNVKMTVVFIRTVSLFLWGLN